ncbi:MAG: hypothetical protein QW470_06815 [Candidatus Caldarchaeum sp.]
MTVITLVLLLAALFLAAYVLLALLSSRGVGRSEGFAFILLGPLPLVVKGRATVILLAAAVVLVFLLLVMF